MSVVSLTVSPDDGSGPEEVPGRWRLDFFLIEYWTILWGVVCVGVEAGCSFRFVGFFPINPSVVNDDSCGVYSRPYHSCVIACVMQVREEHAMGHDSGGH